MFTFPKQARPNSGSAVEKYKRETQKALQVFAATIKTNAQYKLICSLSQQ